MRLINRRGHRLLGQLERSTCATAGGLNASRRLRTQQEQRTTPGAVRSNDECLLDVGGLRRTGDEDAKAGAFEADSLVGFMHVIDNRLPDTTSTRCWVTTKMARCGPRLAPGIQTAPFSATAS